ncbi:MAG: ShlB/FhaC/HecB family hemolysin secretion/activation protein [Polaromonas sp.]|nr:ShlB/FhaC/HecB family hemolysin secretion/activation protein [Polaromonas sp.]
MNRIDRLKMILKPSPFSALSSAVLLALYGGSALAQTAPAPNAGQVLRDLQQSPTPIPPQSLPLQRIEEAAAPVPGDQAKVLVKSVVITGNQEVPGTALQPLVEGLVGSERTLAQLNAAARRLTNYYRREGFAVARAYLPAQDITDGVVNISIIEGRISSHRVANTSLLSDTTANAYIGQIRDGDVIRSGQIDRGLLLLQDTPGVGSSRATLQPGASVGTSELLIEVNPAAPYYGNVVVDNYGSRYTGEYRVGGSFNLASPLKIGDQLSFSALTSGSGLSFGRLAYQLPVGSDGLRVGLAYFDTRYKLGREFESLQANGSATSTSVFAGYPLIRSQAKNLNGTVSYEVKSLNDRVDATGTQTGKKVHVTSAGLSGNLQDALWGGGINAFDLSLVMGRLDIQSATARLIDASSAGTNGSYTRMAYTLSRLQRLGNSTLLSASLSGQQAGKNLDSSEKFSLGGLNGVRAYPQGEASGDEGYRGTLELRQALLPNLQGTLFYDFGTIRINKSTFGPAASNNRKLSGAGVGLNATLSAVQLRAALAWRVDGGLPTSLPASQVKTPTLLLQASLAF